MEQRGQASREIGTAKFGALEAEEAGFEMMLIFCVRQDGEVEIYRDGRLKTEWYVGMLEQYVKSMRQELDNKK